MRIESGKILNQNLVWVIVGLVVWLTGCSASHRVAIVSPGDPPLKNSGPVETSKNAPLVSEAVPSVPEADKATKEIMPFSPEPPNTQEPQPEPIQEDILAQPAEETMRSQALIDVFFDYDQYMVRLDAIPTLEKNAKLLMKRFKGREVIIQGHCDERGTEEYNLILGDRRATAVKNFLTYLGVSAENLRVLSLGKTQPFCEARTPECMQQNRRAHFVLK